MITDYRIDQFKTLVQFLRQLKYFKVAHLTFSLESRSNKQEEAKLIESVFKKPLFVARESNLRFSQALVAIPFSLVCYC